MGQLRKRGSIWWLRYYRQGRRIEESSESTKWETARDILRDREGEIAKGVPITPQSNRLTFDDAAKDVLADYDANGNRSKDTVERRLRLHLTPYFGGRKLGAISTADIRAFQAQRLEAGAKPGEINRELAIVKRAFKLAADSDRYHKRIPKIPMLQERNIRTGFFDEAMLEAVRGHLSPALQPIVTFAFLTGWRVQSEVLPLRWRNVDRVKGEVRLDPGTTKNDAGRVFPFTAGLRTLFDDLWREHEALRAKDEICQWVFQRHGKRIRTFRGAWVKACTAAGHAGLILLDLRRSAVRNMERKGLSRSVAMQLTGHKTESVYRRYAITSEADLREGVERLESTTGTISGDKQAHASGLPGKQSA